MQKHKYKLTGISYFQFYKRKDKVLTHKPAISSDKFKTVGFRLCEKKKT